MSKIIKAVNAMVSNSNLISMAINGTSDREIFFIYDGKHKWSIIKNIDNEYVLIYYPGNDDLSYIAGIPDEYWEQSNVRTVRYSTSELGTKEAIESMAELFTIVSEKLYGMDDILDEIIKTDLPF
jgi:hypothetical protein